MKRIDDISKLKIGDRIYYLGVKDSIAEVISVPDKWGDLLIYLSNRGAFSLNEVKGTTLKGLNIDDKWLKFKTRDFTYIFSYDTEHCYASTTVKDSKLARKLYPKFEVIEDGYIRIEL